MPLYDFRCSICGAVYEVKRPASRLADPLLCAVDNAPCERLLTAPSFVTKSNPSLRGPRTISSWYVPPGSCAQIQIGRAHV